MGRKGNDKVYALVDDLVNIGTVELGTIGITLEKAQDAMRNIANALCFRYARTILYVPANLELQLGRRDEQIYQQHGQDGPDGARKYSAQRVAQLAEEHKLTTVHVYANSTICVTASTASIANCCDCSTIAHVWRRRSASSRRRPARRCCSAPNAKRRFSRGGRPIIPARCRTRRSRSCIAS